MSVILLDGRPAAVVQALSQTDTSMVPKPSGEGLRLVCDIRKLNEVTKQDMFEPPGCDLCLEWMQQWKVHHHCGLKR